MEQQIQQKKLLDYLPEEFIQFLDTFKIDKKIFENIDINNQFRYVRIKESSGETYQLQDLQEKFDNKDIQKVDLIDNLYKIDKKININNNELYKNGELYGIDLGSAFAVKSLGIEQKDKAQQQIDVLDLCCAPGAKLCYIGDILKKEFNEFSLTGIDISENRLNICKSLCRKYGHVSKERQEYKILLHDGTTFNDNGKLYDRVIVDAECTHEGSIKHLIKWAKKFQEKNQDQILSKKQQKINNKQKSNEWDITSFKERFLEPGRLSQICELQYNLLKNGYSLLKEGGQMIYSTCSLAQCQNEDIISRLLSDYPSCQLIPILSEDTLNSHPWILQGILKNTIKFDPIKSECGGMFIAKIHKPIE